MKAVTCSKGAFSVVSQPSPGVRNVVTYKAAAVDAGSGSKPEAET